MLSWVTLAAAILCNILGNYFIKRFSINAEVNSVLDYFRSSFIAGTLFFGLGLLLYTRALKELPITLAYPLMIGITMMALSVLAVLSLGERIGFRDAIGAVFVVAGVVLLSRGA